MIDRDFTFEELTPDGPGCCWANGCKQTEDDDNLIECEYCRRSFCSDHATTATFDFIDGSLGSAVYCEKCAPQALADLAEGDKELAEYDAAGRRYVGTIRTTAARTKEPG